ncbi:MAG: STAS/SEC14 domain-containing protein [Candidatus Dadabacteria bacterium]|nr:STAS/SEC14 domain-containing protein [Candidatus Dadabacteria bacterium]NIS08764.1 STAS/SEC14 domain-containing protein [Candidatus Dadabacteria bacterium]NIV42707.1 STAS/SEC14 domain-containing protein [Candidatus Dadabacteria bacterium]NIX15450.1 STAS/SEC14 domain-containing protein [Candidatus Dadabacteria bacterium]NIY22112.1 STAS/SEC14 domain-containing protein [Candidatus Dadabacteria bacterium]
MLNLIELNADHVIGCVVDGKIGSDDIEAIWNEIDRKFKSHEKLSVYVEVKDYGGISLDAFFEDLKHGFKHFSDFDKKAVVTDKKWMMKMAPVVDKIFPNIEVKCFSFEDKDKAIEWVKS